MDLTTLKTLIDQELEALFPENKEPWHELHLAMRYALLGNGKRLRPLLLLVITEAVKGPLDAALIPAIAIELIHTFSLIQDDLPCMDDDTMRRGKPTLHCAFSEATALLASDALFAKAFEWITEAKIIPPTQKIELLHLLTSACQNLMRGQLLDLERDCHDKKVIRTLKTGKLFEAAVESALIISNAQDPGLYREFAKHFGAAFQLCDDQQDGDLDDPKELEQEITLLKTLLKKINHPLLSQLVDLSLHEPHLLLKK